jgi:hypothetical protein
MLVSRVVCALPLGLVAATPAQQVSPAAPENLRCPGRPAPSLPGPGWTAEPVWEWRDLVRSGRGMARTPWRWIASATIT